MLTVSRLACTSPIPKVSGLYEPRLKCSEDKYCCLIVCLSRLPRQLLTLLIGSQRPHEGGQQQE